MMLALTPLCLQPSGVITGLITSANEQGRPTGCLTHIPHCPRSTQTVHPRRLSQTQSTISWKPPPPLLPPLLPPTHLNMRTSQELRSQCTTTPPQPRRPASRINTAVTILPVVSHVHTCYNSPWALEVAMVIQFTCPSLYAS